MCFLVVIGVYVFHEIRIILYLQFGALPLLSTCHHEHFLVILNALQLQIRRLVAAC